MKNTTAQLLDSISHLDTSEIDTILTALSQQYSTLHPGWEIAVLTLPKHDSFERKRILSRVLEYEQLREGQ